MIIQLKSHFVIMVSKGETYMKPIKITNLFTSYYSIPDYQRDYEWKNSETSTLFEDISSLIKENKNIPHFIGAIVTIPFEKDYSTNKSIDFDDYSISSSNIKHVIDGQQRLTTFCLLIAALRNVISADDSIVNDKKKTYEQLLNRYLLGGDFHRQTFKPAPYVILNGNTGNYYNNNILGVTDANSDGKFKGAKRLSAAFTLFKRDIAKLRDEMVTGDKYTISSNDDFYTKFIQIISSNITLAEIDCDDSTNAFQVFDSLNGKGLDLTAADRIKNITMSWNPGTSMIQKWDALANNIGEDYVVNFFVTLFFYEKQKRVSKSKLPEEFKDLYKDSASTNYESFFSKLNNDAILYGQLRKSNTGNKELDNILKDLKQLNCEQIYVILFAVCKHYGFNLAANNESLIQLAKKITSLVVRMQVSDKNFNRLDSLFNRCITDMKTKNADIDAITTNVNNELYKLVDDETFKSDFKSFSPEDNNVSEFYLRHLELYIRKTFDQNRSDVERGLTVEHIIPQTLTDLKDWYGDSIDECPEEIKEDFESSVVQNIGNKLLLFGDDNSSAGNNNYNDKINVYRNGKRGQNNGTPASTFKMVKDLLENYPSRFNHNEVFKRAEELAGYAVEIWK